MSIILMTTLFYKALLLEGEIWRWSLLELKGLMPSRGTHKRDFQLTPLSYQG